MLRFLLLAWVLVGATQAQGQLFDDRFTEERVSIEKQFVEARKYKLIGDYQAAADLLLQLVKKHRNHDAGAFELADVYLRLGNLDEALHYANLAIGIDGSNKWYLLVKARILEEDQQSDET